MKNATIVVLILAVLWLSAQVIRLEQYHYASYVGLCSEFKPEDPMGLSKRDKCLSSTETRTNVLWHLYYGVFTRY